MHPDSAHFGASLPRELPHAVREVVSLAMVAIWAKTSPKWSHLVIQKFLPGFSIAGILKHKKHYKCVKTVT